MNDERALRIKRALSFITHHSSFLFILKALCNLSVKRFLLLANPVSFSLDIFVRYPQYGGRKRLTMTEE